jgi:hypothetical protein
MHDTDDLGSNPTSNPHLQDLIDARLGRRDVMKGTLAAAATAMLGGAALAPSPALALRGRTPRLGFAEVPPSNTDTFVVPQGYRAQVLIPWGTPLFADAPEFREDASNTAADQERQVGFNHDGMHFFPLAPWRSRRGLLVVNHEYTDASQIYTAAQGSAITPDAAGREKVAKALAAHGVTVVEIRRDADGGWAPVRGSPWNRRVTGTTPMAFSGPVRADHPMLRAAMTPAPIGTLNDCAHGVTPWGTYLACEENFNGYFGTDDAAWRPSALEARYGITAAGFGYGWHRAEPRFDLAVNGNELHRFGWVVEIDPRRPGSTPVKRTALGRIKHEGATCTESRGRVVVYTGDDENGDYLYKFVGDRPWRERRARGESPLDHGTLHVARFGADGTGEWLPVVHGEGPLTVANGWADQADVLIRTRQAADALGATRLHRPEWVAVHPHTGDVYVTLTNGSGNSAPVNSGRDPNPYGHVIRFAEDRRSDAAFTWDVFLLAGDPVYDPRVPADQAIFGSPDGIYVDDAGIVWIETDVSNGSQNRPERGHDRIGNNQVLAAVPETGELRRFLTGPRGCEITGAIMTPDRKTLFVNVQHPGESTTFWDAQFGRPTTANPSTVSRWPFGGRPRPATVAITREDGGEIGS